MMCTYFTKEERNELLDVEDDELNEIFQEVVEKFGDEIFVTESTYLTKKNYFSKYKTKTHYSVYVAINDCEAQCLSFLTNQGDTNKPIVFAFFMGLLAGEKRRKI